MGKILGQMSDGGGGIQDESVGVEITTTTTTTVSNSAVAQDATVTLRNGDVSVKTEDQD